MAPPTEKPFKPASSISFAAKYPSGLLKVLPALGYSKGCFSLRFPASSRIWLLMASLLTVLAVGAWLFTISLLLSLVSIVVIMKLFYQYEQQFGMRSTSLLNVIGSNTIAIYTTHRILVEIFSLTLLAQMNAARWSPQVELTLLLGYPFVSLFICTVAGLLVRKLSQRAFSDLLFSPPSLPAAISYSR